MQEALFDIRLVRLSDAAQILEIYGPIVINTAISFEIEVPSEEEFQERIRAYSATAPWLVAELNNRIIGYAYATAHRSRQAYQWNQEVTVYVHQEYRRFGVAKKLYLLLLNMLRSMNYEKAIAVITLPNEASVAFHQNLGFQHIGDMSNIGFKHGQWYNTSWWDYKLQPNNSPPQPLKSLIEVTESFKLNM
ncbi:GNAT family N-acetyltransferase [Roseivirga sp.]|uniref:GNAT family N-acetyltransferase n=1 Tax=Roseivirga sp. TaxID=1964215 RepID=UPI003B52ED8B